MEFFDGKIIVLDDDPTGIQTVHDVFVYTDWEEATLREAFLAKEKMFYILTNSRSFSEEKTKQVHQEIGSRIKRIGKELNLPFLILSRGDSTLRGHYPLETEELKAAIEEEEARFDGEVLCPFFYEGGRVTLHGIHYLKEGEELFPVGESEFAKDRSFPYKNSDLSEYVEEKTKGRYLAKNCIKIDLEALKNKEIEAVYRSLMQVRDFNKIIVDASNYEELEVFLQAFSKALQSGKHFLVRCAASLPKVLGQIADQELLPREVFRQGNEEQGGIVLIGSHVQKTTKQLELLREAPLDLEFIEVNANLLIYEDEREKEIQNTLSMLENNIQRGKTTVVYTSRKLVEIGTIDKEKILEASVKISDALTSIIASLQVNPRFIIAKGGITSSDIGTKALAVKKAFVLGQIKPGIPVWRTGEESKIPNLLYIIFPGNVGQAETLTEIVELLL